MQMSICPCLLSSPLLSSSFSRTRALHSPVRAHGRSPVRAHGRADGVLLPRVPAAATAGIELVSPTTAVGIQLVHAHPRYSGLRPPARGGGGWGQSARPTSSFVYLLTLISSTYLVEGIEVACAELQFSKESKVPVIEAVRNDTKCSPTFTTISATSSPRSSARTRCATPTRSGPPRPARCHIQQCRHRRKPLWPLLGAADAQGSDYC